MTPADAPSTPGQASWLETGRAIAGPTVRRLRSVLQSSPRHKRIRWAPRGLPVDISSANGLTLRGRLYRATAGQKGPGLLVLHSSDPRGQQHGLYVAFADAMRRRGFTVLTFNFRGYPGSDAPADRHDFAMENLVQDVRAALDLLLETGAVLPERIALYGHSYGAGIGIHDSGK